MVYECDFYIFITLIPKNTILYVLIIFLSQCFNTYNIIIIHLKKFYFMLTLINDVFELGIYKV